jgi:hypothetical protein
VPDCVSAGRVDVGVEDNLESPAKGFATVEVGTPPVSRRSSHQKQARVLSAGSRRTRRREQRLGWRGVY